jgi:NAD(P)-dependent dehydrogenase (short-subunit alcohol dehydrogenase family)
MADKKIALVTGGNRGLGFETCRQLLARDLRVILTCRRETEGTRAAERLRTAGDVSFHLLDTTDPASIAGVYRHVAEQFGRLDVLVNNAGILIDRDAGILTADLDVIRKTVETNVYGPILLCEAFVPLMRKNGYGRIVNVSSGMGQLEDMGGGYPAYRLSKVSLNAVTRMLAQETKGMGILVNSVCPGWVKTDMGGDGATRTPEQGAETIVWAATLSDNGPTGSFFRDKKAIPW